ncbi:AEC family transporter [Metamycoplasma canadense]|uniref:Malate permease n=1 Tax=Metamycoplasma canadense TaxID=29554 RepID=A0A077L8M0_9BACT|nr:AEC family transporter [Metamycoplasma canadense]BAP39393.1 hypothetical protein MCAN360_0126 [Metamycoplasma canadense]
MEIGQTKLSSGALFLGTISNTGLWGAIISTLIITFLGYILYKTKVLNDGAVGAVQKLIINIIIPFLSFYSFMKNAEKDDIKTYAIVFGLSAVYYIALTTMAIFWMKFLPKLVPKSVIRRAEADFNEYQKNVEFDIKQIWNQEAYLEKLQRKHLVTWLMCIYGSNILFATPIVLGVYGSTSSELGSLNIWNILYYVGGFGLSFSLVSGVKFTKKEFKYTLKKAFLNPAFIVVIIAILLWATQYIPKWGATVSDIQKTIYVQNGKITADKLATFGPNFSSLYGVTEGNKTIWYEFSRKFNNYVVYSGRPTGWFDWQVTMPYLAKPIKILAELISPLIWIVIGTSLAKTKIKEMFKNKQNWLFLFYKSGIMPLVILGLISFFVYKKLIPVNVGAVLVMVGSVPPGTTVVIYAQHFKNHGDYTSQVSSLSTLTSFIFIPAWLVIGQLALNSIAG